MTPSHVQLVVWTASSKSYADAIIDLLDADGELFSHRLYRESCSKIGAVYVKDLRRLGRPMNAVVLVDNYVYSFGMTLDNGVPIAPWTGDEVMTNAPFFVIHCYKFVGSLYLRLSVNFGTKPHILTLFYYYIQILLKDD